MPRVLLLLPTTTYKAPDFLAAARKLRVDVTVASEEPSTLEGMNPAGLLSLDFRDAEGCARKAVEFARAHPVDAVVGVDEDTAVAAAVIARALGLLSLDFRDAEGCARKAVEFARAHPVDAVVGVDEDTAVAAAVIARALGL